MVSGVCHCTRLFSFFRQPLPSLDAAPWGHHATPGDNAALRPHPSKYEHSNPARVLLWASALLVWLGSQWLVPIAAAEIDFPAIDPAFRIMVDADRVAHERRGAYDVLAFDGNCKLTQGELSGSAEELVLWIERDGLDVDNPGKVICYLSGQVQVQWGEQHQLRDNRWMARLFSLHPIEMSERTQKVRRHDIPYLDWNLEPGGAVQLAQFAQPALGDNPNLYAPPLLSQGDGSQLSLVPSMPAMQPPSSVPLVPGAVPWNGGNSNARQGSTANADLLPSGGLVIPDDGGQPYPAAGIVSPQPTATLAPAFPSQASQVVRQVPTPSPFAAKSFQILPRSAGSPPSVTWTPNEERGETIGQITGGFKLIVSGIQIAQSDGSLADYGSVALEADNAVFWRRGTEPLTLAGQSTPDRPIELYLDGNIVFNQGNRVIYADRMYYNISSEYGMVLSAEVLTPAPQFQGLLRLKADVLQQRDRENFKAYGAALTSSRLGVPRYWLQADEVDLQDTRDEVDLSVYAPTDASRGTNMRATARNNFVYLGGVPVFYWPTFATNLAEPSFYLSSVRFNNDRIFGFQTYTQFDLYQLLGIQGWDGTRLRGSLDYLSERGPAIGGRFEYNRPTWLFGAPGVGFTDAWLISDDGLDVLGSDRANLTPESSVRGRILGRHRLFLSQNVELMAESGWISDRNFLEQYFEEEWDREKDFTTALRLRSYNGNRMFDIYGQARVNDFFTETEALPRIDHYWLGQDLFGERFTWSAHNTVGYVRQRVASTPLNPQEIAKFNLLPWESESEGLRAISRQELSLPVSLGAWELVPYVSGEAGFWKEDVNQEDQTRLTGQAGLRTSLPFWRVYPNIENRLLDLRGIAHKVTLKSDLFYADSNRDLDLFPLYDPLDDNSQEHFRRRFISNTFCGVLPERFDERNYALRSGMQRWVTAGSSEIVDDLAQLRMGMNQRWQTKRGLAGRERIVDLISLDTDFIFFPKAERDNFGEDIGAINYDLRYHVGDRLTLLSDGYFDVFSQGLKSVSAGAQISRPGRGDVYIGMLSLEGPISANVLNGFTNYRLNDKWIFTGGAAYDFSGTGSIGQNLALTRIGETALVRFGVNVDSGRDNVSFNFNFEPRFLPTQRLGGLGGELIPPVGLFGLE